MSKGKGKAPAKKAPAKEAPAKKEVVASKGGKAHYSAKMRVTKSKKLSGISAAAKPAIGGRGSVSSQGVSDVLALNKES